MTEVAGGPPGLDTASVEAWMLENVAGLSAPLHFEVLSGGHSNLTYTVDDAAGRRCVLRRPPLGKAGGRAHDMGREHRVIAALAPTAVPVPDAFALCEDEAVNGRPFYVMSHAAGQVIDNPPTVRKALPTPHLRRRASDQIVDVLAALHRVDIDAVGLGDAARREDFLGRQLRRLQDVWSQTKTRELLLMDEVHAGLADSAPAQRYTGIVHSDYRFGNVMVEGDGTLTAVLDWELWTLGDVLADLGFLMNNWYEPGEVTPQVWMEVPPTSAGGFASRDEVVARYVDATGFDVSDLPYYRAFQHWKIAVIAEGVKRRYETSTMANTDVDFDHLDRRVVQMSELARQQLAQLG